MLVVACWLLVVGSDHGIRESAVLVTELSRGDLFASHMHRKCYAKGTRTHRCMGVAMIRIVSISSRDVSIVPKLH